MTQTIAAELKILIEKKRSAEDEHFDAIWDAPEKLIEAERNHQLASIKIAAFVCTRAVDIIRALEESDL